MRRSIVLFAFLFLLFSNHVARAWNSDGHQIVGAIADELLAPNAKRQIASLIGVDLRTASPWLDCVKSVHRQEDGVFRYVVEPRYEPPCTPFAQARSVMEDYVKRNFIQCSYPVHRKSGTLEFDEEMGCHNTYHFSDISVLRDRFDRNFQGTNDHDIVASINAAIAVLLGRPSPPPFKIATRQEALFLLAHLIGDLHQPLHVGSVYLDANASQVDPDITHTIDPTTETIGGNAIFDQNRNLHADWDAPPTGLDIVHALDLLPLARQVIPNAGRVENWSVEWATDTMKSAPKVFDGGSFATVQPSSAHPRGGWSIAFADHAAYSRMRDYIKRQQMAKAGARLANLLNAIWP